jgi:hypothetical protein
MVAKIDESELFCRVCSHCGKGMNSGFMVDNGEQYFCSEPCLHTEYTAKEWLELYDDGQSESFWTEWFQEDEDQLYNKEGVLVLEK